MDMKKILLFFGFIFMLSLVGCKEEKPKNEEVEPEIKEEDKETEKPHEHTISDWIYPEGWECGDEVIAKKICTECGEVLEEEEIYIEHDIEIEIIEPTCTENGKQIRKCKNCAYRYETKIYKTGHNPSNYITVTEATDDKPGTKMVVCLNCGEVLQEFKYVKNGYLDHGALHVDGCDLMDEHNEKYQLYGLSYHGLQWFGRYVNYDTICALQQQFGINVIRLACYTSEDGYAEGGETVKANYKQYIDNAITTASKIGLYVVVDWHMVGAENVNDKNPLYYMEDAKEFFGYVSSKYKDYDNVIYEIMNEPCGDTTWEDCKEYANTIIPIIRENTNAVILVGNPHWSADLNSVIKDPLVGYENIMYTYHFYAGDTSNTSQVVNAYSKGIPVFISEFGFMDADGDGSMSYASGENWLKVLDERNISYIAWNISNSKGSASIIKQGNSTMTDFSDENLKEWGIYLKNYYLKKAGLKK